MCRLEYLASQWVCKRAEDDVGVAECRSQLVRRELMVVRVERRTEPGREFGFHGIWQASGDDDLLGHGLGIAASGVSSSEAVSASGRL
jgi:hypothetical protein